MWLAYLSIFHRRIYRRRVIDGNSLSSIGGGVSL